MKLLKQSSFWLAVIFSGMLYQQIISPREELTATRWILITLAAINIPLQLFIAYQKSREHKK